MKVLANLILYGALVAVILAVPRALAAGPPVLVIVNQKNPAATLSPSDLKKLVTGGTKVWDFGAVVQLGIIPGDASETIGLASLLDTTPRELMSLLQQQVFKGDLRRPVVIRSSADCIALAASTPGALCVAVAGTRIAEGARSVPMP